MSRLRLFDINGSVSLNDPDYETMTGLSLGIVFNLFCFHPLFYSIFICARWLQKYVQSIDYNSCSFCSSATCCTSWKITSRT